MVDVKVPRLPPLPDDVEAHVVALADRLLQVVCQALLAQDWGGLRNSHFRLLGCIPPAGTTITEPSAVLFLTKQAVGQFVMRLEETGHLAVRTEDQDRRRRIITRTAEGDRVVREVNGTIADLERQWSGQVGREDYRTFLRVLERIALDEPTA